MAPRDGGKVEHLDRERQEMGEGEPLEREPRAVAGIHYPVHKSRVLTLTLSLLTFLMLFHELTRAPAALAEGDQAPVVNE